MKISMNMSKKLLGDVAKIQKLSDIPTRTRVFEIACALTARLLEAQQEGKTIQVVDNNNVSTIDIVV